MNPAKKEVFQAMYQRRSRREFTEEPVSENDLEEIIQAGVWAPSGLNNQPWRFVIVQDGEVRRELAGTTKYGHIILGAPALIAVYLDKQAMYNEKKDQQAAGACIQNMLLAVEALSLGAVWLGQILQKSAEVNEILGLGDDLELQALLAVGHPSQTNQQSSRKDLAGFILKKM